MRNFYYLLLLGVCAFVPLAAGAEPRGSMTGDYNLYARSNLVAWCIVPFDARKRGPEEHAAMLEKLGFKLFAYDYRAEHPPSFDTEMDASQRHHVRLLAWWFPGELNAEARLILDVLKRHELRGVQLWVTGSRPEGARSNRGGEDPRDRECGQRDWMQCGPLQSWRLVWRARKPDCNNRESAVARSHQRRHCLQPTSRSCACRAFRPAFGRDEKVSGSLKPQRHGR